MDQGQPFQPAALPPQRPLHRRAPRHLVGRHRTEIRSRARHGHAGRQLRDPFRQAGALGWRQGRRRRAPDPGRRPGDLDLCEGRGLAPARFIFSCLVANVRWLQFTANQTSSWGIVEGDRVIAVDGDPFSEWQRTPRTHALTDVKIELPLVPRTFYCVGLNYLKHLKEAADKRGEVPKVPDRPEVGYRAQNALFAHDENVVIPASATEQIHYEGELVVVIGKKAKHLNDQNAMDCVFGY